MPLVGGIAVPEEDLAVLGEGAAVGFVNTEGEKAADVGGGCGRFADGEVDWSSPSDCSPESSGAFLRFFRE